jgi:aminoglycoside phosphotransferase (APT) family kinase protein
MALIEVPFRHQFNVDNLHRYLQANISAYKCSNGKLAVLQFAHGQSNPTFSLKTDYGQEYVLRKQPSGELLVGAHRVDREFQIISALHSIGYPVPRPFVLCTDPEVIGVAFYIMELVRGRIFRDIRLPEVSSSEERSSLYRSFVDTLVRLHQVDWKRLNLASYGGRSRRSYCERQISVWSNNYRMACVDGEPGAEMERLMDWLPGNIPPEPHPITIVHGDYRIDNVIFHPTEPRVLAVLDWELSTLGHPLVDLSHVCLMYLSIPGSQCIMGVAGAPDEPTLTKWYADAANRPHPLPNWPFFRALACFRIAAIAQVRDAILASLYQSVVLRESMHVVYRVMPAAILLHCINIQSIL